jgi:hypothetical protein
LEPDLDNASGGKMRNSFYPYACGIGVFYLRGPPSGYLLVEPPLIKKQQEEICSNE